MSIRPLSELLTEFSQSIDPKDTVCLEDIILVLHERGIAALLFILAAPMALPIPVPPGLNILLASPLILLTFQQFFGTKTIWLPARLKEKPFQKHKLQNMLSNIIKHLKKIEFLLKPRLGWMTGPLMARITGLCGLIMALTVCIPIPLTNTVPSFGIAIMALGMTTRDGFAVIAGLLIGMAWVGMLAGAAIFFGPDAIDIIKETIKSWL